MKLRIAIACSLALHLALLAALTGGVWLRGGEYRAGPGDAVAVWIESPEGSAGGGSRAAGTSGKTGAGAIAAPVSQPGDGGSEAREANAGPDEGVGGGDSTGNAGVAGGRGTGGSSLLANIWRRIDRSKYYPAAARRRGISGAPRVSFAISRDGAIEWVKLVESSGEALLDDAALATVQRAAPLPYYPAPITLAVKYSMDE